MVQIDLFRGLAALTQANSVGYPEVQGLLWYSTQSAWSLLRIDPFDGCDNRRNLPRNRMSREVFLLGRGQGGDAPPRPGCARLWHGKVLAKLQAIELTLLVGLHVQRLFLESVANRP